MEYVIVDLETTANGGPNGDDPEAHWDVNRVLVSGHRWYGMDPTVITRPNCRQLLKEINQMQNDGMLVTVVAHNAKFDIKHLIREAQHHGIPIDWSVLGVWDTMTFQYRYEGHARKLPSLEYTATFWGITATKTLDLGAILATGIKMEDIDRGQLTEYLVNDVDILAEIFKEQFTCGEEYEMGYILPLCEMELNGLPIDQAKAKAMHVDLTKDIWDHLQQMMEYITRECEWQDGTPVTRDDFSESVGIKSKCIKPFANRTISFLLFGAPKELKITNKWRLRTKTGQCIYDPALYYSEPPSHIGYPMDEAKLSSIYDSKPSGLISLVLQYRLDSKLDGTYIGPFVETSKIQGCVYPKLNTAITGTGRLSSSQPNGQNMPPTARQLVTAGDGMEMEELDFSQLEMVGAATVSGCQALIYDLNAGKDVHYETASRVFGAAQAKAKHKLAKNVNFGVLYGGKAPGLSKQTGVDKDTIQELIDSFFKLYPGVKAFQKGMYEEVVDAMRPYDVKDGEQRYYSDWLLPASGRKFRFVENEAPVWLRNKTGRKWSFSPNHTANYPIQGFAGGDIVMAALLHMWASMRRDYLGVKFRMTVHDSILIEKPAGLDLDKYYKAACTYVEGKFNLPLPLEYDVESGKTWQ